MGISLLPAFLGGALALLSPCGALLLPGYLASTVTRRAGLLLHGAVFYVGLLLTLVPLGVGAGALGGLLAQHRAVLVAATSVLLILLGAVHALGIGLDPARVLPGADRLRQASARGSGQPRTFLLGAVGGVAGVCAGPVLGAVLTLALGQGGILRAAVLLAAYGAGMVVPLLLLALTWEKLGPRSRRLLRGRPLALGPLTLHSTTLLTGLLIIALGVLFWTTNGLISLPSLVPTRVLAQWQESLAPLSSTGVQIAVIAGLAALALLLWWRAERRGAAESADRTADGAAGGRTADGAADDAAAGSADGTAGPQDRRGR
ncbi:cytochrome c biogenesis CcdA family protein [Brachybacterium atlanticum]|uniref:cytochrome c biogenesis CcdA family protein n=1 Tax=Brachybacterium atlanticum TaxID=2911888 RepID=UPI0021DF8DC8|nr:cytochrome c biogenesis CcdA family protein [Brachybacterium atlanticum]